MILTLFFENFRHTISHFVNVWQTAVDVGGTLCLWLVGSVDLCDGEWWTEYRLVCSHC